MSHCIVDLREQCNYSLRLQLRAAVALLLALKPLYKMWDLFDLKKKRINFPPVFALCTFFSPPQALTVQ